MRPAVGDVEHVARLLRALQQPPLPCRLTRPCFCQLSGAFLSVERGVLEKTTRKSRKLRENRENYEKIAGMGVNAELENYDPYDPYELAAATRQCRSPAATPADAGSRAQHRWVVAEASACVRAPARCI
jgi:hypothetical protein